MVINIRRDKICKISIAFLVLPFMIFCIGWMKWSIALFSIVLVLISCYCFSRKIENDYITISIHGVLLLLAFVMLFIWICGIGGFFPQSFDMYMRNAIYKDLILKEWPVFYSETNRVLVYYFGYWMPPAAITKFFALFLSEYNVWLVGKILLFIYSVIYLMVILLYILLIVYGKRKEIVCSKDIFKICTIFFCWGSLCVLGLFSGNLLFGIESESISALINKPIMWEHYLDYIGSTNCNLTLTMHVFNQSLPVWLSTCLFIDFRNDIKRYGIIALPLTFLSPLPLFGLVALMLGQWFVKFIQNKRTAWKEVFSISNICSLIFVVIIGLFYYGGETTSFQIKNLWNYSPIAVILSLILYIMLSIGLYLVICSNKIDGYKIYIVLLYVIFSTIQVGNTGDFSMRAIVPLVFWIMIDCMIFIIDKNSEKIRKAIMYILLTISALVPVSVMVFMINQGIKNGSLIGDFELIYTLENIAGESDNPIIGQYTKANPSEDLFFDKFVKGKYDIKHPVLEYSLDEDGHVLAAYLTKNQVDIFFDSVIIDDEKKSEVYKKLKDEDGVVGVKFDENDKIMPIKTLNKMIIPENISIEWKNVSSRLSTGKKVFLKLELKNDSEIIIPKSNNKGGEYGISIKLLDRDGNLIQYPYGYVYCNHAIFPSAKETLILPVYAPDKLGDYIFELCFFYTFEGETYFIEKQKYYFSVK